MRNTPAPPLPNSGLTMMSLCSSRKERIASRSQVIIVGGISSGKCVTSSFSGAFRTAAGSFTTSVLRMDVLQQMGGSDVSHIERRVLAHQHHVHGCEVQQDQLAEAVVGTPLAFDRDRAGARVQTLFATFALPPDALAQRHVAYLVMP